MSKLYARQIVDIVLTQKTPAEAGVSKLLIFGCGGRIRTYDLQVMSPSPQGKLFNKIRWISAIGWCRVALVLPLAEQAAFDLGHATLVIGRREQVSVALHGHLDRAVPGEGHHLLDAEALLYPQAHGEVP